MKEEVTCNEFERIIMRLYPECNLTSEIDNILQNVLGTDIKELYVAYKNEAVMDYSNSLYQLLISYFISRSRRLESFITFCTAN